MERYFTVDESAIPIRFDSKLYALHLSSFISASKVRLATLEMSTLLLKQLVYKDAHCFLQDRHLAAVEGSREESTLLLRNFYKVWEKVDMIHISFCSVLVPLVAFLFCKIIFSRHINYRKLMATSVNHH